MTPVEPIAIRIKLPFTVTQNDEDQCLTLGHWPRNRSGLRDLLDALNHDRRLHRQVKIENRER